MSATITRPAEVKQLGTILGVWAHPDDETFCAAGLLAAAVANGQRVICVTFTKGEAGVRDEKQWPPQKLGKIREHELSAALQVLGITDYHCLGYADGGCTKVASEEGSQAVKAFIETHLPDTILTFGPEGLTGHPDHQAVSRWVDQAVQGTDIAVYHVVQDRAIYDQYMKALDGQFNFYFNIDKPPLYNAEDCNIGLHLSPELCQQKCAALKAMPSQTEAMFKASPDGFMEAALSCECYIKAQ